MEVGIGVLQLGSSCEGGGRDVLTQDEKGCGAAGARGHLRGVCVSAFYGPLCIFIHLGAVFCVRPVFGQSLNCTQGNTKFLLYSKCPLFYQLFWKWVFLKLKCY